MSDHPERVYVENEWYDGPRAGIADINGVPHRFKSMFDEADDDYVGTMQVWPVDAATLALEIEQWRIFVDWNDRYESGKVSVESHPGNVGVNQRWGELEALLERSRSVPSGARKATVKVVSIDGRNRYEASGPAYMMRWTLL
jgi:hypothetical protein